MKARELHAGDLIEIYGGHADKVISVTDTRNGFVRIHTERMVREKVERAYDFPGDTEIGLIARRDDRTWSPTWFIGDSVITRYADDFQIRVTPEVVDDVHQYRIEIRTRPEGKVTWSDHRIQLTEALTLGEEFIP